jgi:hypothetical protein
MSYPIIRFSGKKKSTSPPCSLFFAPLRETIQSFDVLEHIGLYTFNQEMF